MSLADQLEQALTALVSQISGDALPGQDVDGISAIGDLVNAIKAGSVPPDQHKRIKRLHGLACAASESLHKEVQTEIARIHKSKQALGRAVPVTGTQTVGVSCDMSG